MSPFATSMLVELGRTTLWLALAGVSAALVLRLARIQSPALHRTAWCVTLLVGCFLVRLPLEVPWYAAEPVVTPAPQPDLPPLEIPAADLLATFPLAAEVMPHEFDPPIIAATPLPMSEAARSPTARPAGWLPSLPQLAIGVWLAGVAVLVAAWLAGYLWFVWRLPRGLELHADWQAEWKTLLAGQGIRHPIPLRVTGNLGPLLCRLPRGYELLVPEPMWRMLSPPEREAILRHELAHYRRGDVWKSLAARVLALVHWFNPISWWAVRRFDEAAEWACDRAATDGEPTAYAKILMHLSELAGPRARYGSALRGRRLAARIRRLVSPEQKEDSAMKKALLIMAAACVVAAAVVRVQLVAQAPAEPRDAESADSRDSADLPFGDLSQAEPSGSTLKPNPARRHRKPKRSRTIVETAKEAYEAAVAALQAETTVLESVYVWSSRWLAAELSVARNQQQRLAAATAHLERMRQVQKNIKRLYDAGTPGGEALQMASANFYVAEAQRKLAQQKSPLTPPQSSLSPEARRAYQAERARWAELEMQLMLEAARRQRIGPRSSAPPVPIPNAVPAPIRQVPAPRAVDPALPTPQYVPPSATPLPAGPPRAELKAGDAKTVLLYDNKSFGGWATILRTELSPDRRTEALRAIGAFGGNGWGPEAAQAILGAKRDPSPSEEVYKSAIEAFGRIPHDEALPSVLKALKSGTYSQRMFALKVLPIDKAKGEIVPLLVSAIEDPELGFLACTRLAIVDHDNPALADWFRAALSGGNPQDLTSALYLIGGPKISMGRNKPSIQVAPFPAFAPEVISLLGHDNSRKRHEAANALRQMGQAAVPALERESSKSATETTSKRAGQILDQILKPKTGPVKSFDWERE